MKVFKILHKPTGLYFTPSRGHGNLSTNGKIYSRMPRLEWAGTGVRVVVKSWKGSKLTKKHQTLVDYFNIEPDNRGQYWIDKYFEVSMNDWEIIEL